MQLLAGNQVAWPYRNIANERDTVVAKIANNDEMALLCKHDAIMERQFLPHTLTHIHSLTIHAQRFSSAIADKVWHRHVLSNFNIRSDGSAPSILYSTSIFAHFQCIIYDSGATVAAKVCWKSNEFPAMGPCFTVISSSLY